MQLNAVHRSRCFFSVLASFFHRNSHGFSLRWSDLEKKREQFPHLKIVLQRMAHHNFPIHHLGCQLPCLGLNLASIKLTPKRRWQFWDVQLFKHHQMFMNCSIFPGQQGFKPNISGTPHLLRWPLRGRRWPLWSRWWACESPSQTHWVGHTSTNFTPGIQRNPQFIARQRLKGHGFSCVFPKFPKKH